MWARLYLLDILTDFHPADTVTGWAQKYLIYLSIHVSVQFTVPTEEMLAYASLATLGDDVYFEPSTAYVHIVIFFSVVDISPCFLER